MSADAVAALTALTDAERAVLASVADHLIPAAHGMPSAADVLTDDRLRFVLDGAAGPRSSRSGRRSGRTSATTSRRELAALGRDDPAALGALQLAIVAGYYTDKRVRELIGYPGQEAITVRSWELPPYLEEGLIDAVLARGPTWRDPATGQRAVVRDAPRTYAERYAAAPPEGATDGDNGA